MNKLFVALIGLLFIVACNQSTAPPQSNTAAQVSVNVIDADAQPIPDATPEPVTVREISVIAKKFEFAPGSIRLRQGERVKLTVSVPSDDTEHGLAMPDFGVNAKIAPGESKTVEFTADKVGTFEMFCSVPCGSGHKQMRCSVVVE